MSLTQVINQSNTGDAVEVRRKLPAQSVGLIFTSPPYNLKNSSGNGMKDGRASKWAAASLRAGYSDHDDAMPHDKYVDWQREALTEMMRLIPDDGAIFYNHKWRVQNGLLQDRADIVAGFPVRQVIIWKRNGGINFNAGYFLPTFEVIYLIAKKNFRLASKANGCGDVWEFRQEMHNDHPAPFPVALAEQVIKSCPPSVVLDPFIGSGTTAIAALNLKRDYIGIELSPVYAQKARERINNHLTNVRAEP